MFKLIDKKILMSLHSKSCLSQPMQDIATELIKLLIKVLASLTKCPDRQFFGVILFLFVWVDA